MMDTSKIEEGIKGNIQTLLKNSPAENMDLWNISNCWDARGNTIGYHGVFAKYDDTKVPAVIAGLDAVLKEHFPFPEDSKSPLDEKSPNDERAVTTEGEINAHFLVKMSANEQQLAVMRNFANGNITEEMQQTFAEAVQASLREQGTPDSAVGSDAVEAGKIPEKQPGYFQS